MSKSLKQEILDYVKSSKQVTLKDLYTKEALKLQRKVHTINISENSINNFILPKLYKGPNYEQRAY